jgi:hypothetical protein
LELISRGNIFRQRKIGNHCGHRNGFRKHLRHQSSAGEMRYRLG